VDALNSMRVFVKVAEFNSFARASEALDMAVPRTSRVISELEDHLGTRLLQRTTRKMSLTEPGRIYLERCRQILGEIEETYLMLSANAVRPLTSAPTPMSSWTLSLRIAPWI
jgi:DNA-binding transcriptional LysR family regulator